MKLIIILSILFFSTTTYCQPWFSKVYATALRKESAKALLLEGDSIYIRGNYVCDNGNSLCSLLSLFDTKDNALINYKEFNNIQGGGKNIMANIDHLYITSEERHFNDYISISKISKDSFELLSSINLRVDSTKYFNYVVTASIQFYDKLVCSANVLDSLIFIGYNGWNNYQEKAVLFIMNAHLEQDTIIIIPPTSGAFMKIEDMAIGPDSILYISFYEKYLTQGNPDLFLNSRKVVYGYNSRFERKFQWYGPDFTVPESITNLTIGSDSTVYLNYKRDYKAYLIALRSDGLLKWECAFDSDPGHNIYRIQRIIQANNGDVIGSGTISSVVDSLGESGFIFRINQEGVLQWKRAFRINLGLDLQLGPNYPFQSNLEDLVELENGDLLATGFVRRYVGHEAQDGPHNFDVWVIRTSDVGCLWNDCPYIQDIVSKDVYIKLVSSESEWVVEDTSTNSTPIINRFSFSPDSVFINGYFYYEQIFTTAFNSSWQATGILFREDNGKIYQLNQMDTSEILIYDFTVQIGDTLISNSNDINIYSQVIDVGTIELWDEVIRKTITLECISDSLYPDTAFWIEGIGDANFFFRPSSFCFDKEQILDSEEIRCFFTNQQPIYTRPEIGDCYITSIDHPTNKTIAIYPNPVSDILYINNISDNPVKKIMLFNNLGHLVFSVLDLTTGYHLDVSTLTNGLYFGLVNFENGKSESFKILVLAQ